MAGNVTGLHTFAADVGPEPLSLLDTNYGLLTTALNTLSNFTNNYIDSGAANASIVTVAAPQVFSYSDGIVLNVKIAATNTTTTPTINVNALGAKTIVNADGSALVAGQLVAGGWYQLEYESTSGKFQLVGSVGTNTSGSFKQLTVGTPASGVALTVNGAGSSYAGLFTAGGSAGTQRGLSVVTTTQNASDRIINVNNSLSNLFDIFGDGHGDLGPNLSWTTGGTWSLSAPSSGIALTVISASGAPAIQVTGGGTTGNNFGQIIVAGSNSSDYCFRAQSSSSVDYFFVRGDGAVQGRGPVAAALVDMTPDTGTFTATYTGFTGGVTGTATWCRIGKMVILSLPPASGTSNASTFTFTGLPSAIQPASISQQVMAVQPMNNNGAQTAGIDLLISSGSGTGQFRLNTSAAGWTASGVKGWTTNNISVAYLLN